MRGLAREANNRRLVDSGVKRGMCDFGNGGGVVMFEYKKSGDVAFAKGDGFEFHRVLDRCRFEFKGKTVSRRLIRDAVKAIDKACK